MNEALEAAAWLHDHVHTDRDVAHAVMSALVGRTYKSISEWAVAMPEEVILFTEGLRSMVEEIPPEETV